MPLATEGWKARLFRAMGLLRPPAPVEVRSRSELDMGQLFALHYQTSGILFGEFVEVWREVATAFQISPGLIRPADRFGVELPYWRRFGMTDEDVDLSFALTRRHGSGSPEEGMPTVRTVDDYVRLAASRRTEGRVPAGNATEVP
jgi:hypothetical protein